MPRGPSGHWPTPAERTSSNRLPSSWSTTSGHTCSLRCVRTSSSWWNCRPIISTVRSTSISTKAWSCFASQLEGLLSAGAVVALDEWTNALCREQSILFAKGPPVDGGRVISQAKATKTPDELSCMREALRITECAIADVQASIAPGVRQTDLTATFLRTIFEAGADANILDPIWQVMPERMADGPWTTTGDLACPLLSTERELAEGDVLWVDTGISYGGLPLRLWAHLDRRT